MWFTESINTQFEEKQYPVSAYYDELLTQLYGDYMTLPEEAQRTCKVHAVIVDVKHSYQIYLKEQSDMIITDFARSIR